MGADPEVLEPQAAEPAADPAPEPEAQPEPPGFDPEAAYGHLAGQVGEIREAVAGLFQAPVESYGEEPRYTEEEFDPFDANAFRGAVGQEIQRALEPVVQALQPIVQQHNDQMSEQIVNGAFERVGVPEEVRDQVLIMSGGYRLAGQSPEQAIHSAYQAIRGLQGAGAAQGRQDQRDELEQIVTAPGIPHSGQPGAVPGEPRPTTMEDAATRIAARLGIRD